jgi:hypothetical protein
MCDALISRFGSGESECVVDEGGLSWSRAAEFLERACVDGAAVCILATTLAVDAWLSHLGETGEDRALPTGSRVMDTGGEKGRSGLDRSVVVEQLRERLGIPRELVINEFGMTELLSQRYSCPLSTNLATGTRPSPGLHAPPWLWTRALDPETLNELTEGESGVLCHFDLANLGSVCAVLTEDLGRVRGGRIDLAGRAAGAPPRGCSLATADLLAAGGAGRRPEGGPDD